MPSSTPLQCPSCERHVGPARRCPYCNATIPVAPLMRIIRVAAILLATAGLLLLYIAAKHHEPPLILIGSITPVMNFAHVRVSGTVSKRPYKSRDGSSISFTIADDSGDLRVYAYRNVAKALLQDNASLPAAGDRVELKGSLSISAEGTPKLYLKSAEHLTFISELSIP